MPSPNLNPGQSAPFNITPVNASGSPSGGILSALVFNSSDTTQFTVAADPSNPNGGIVTVLPTAKPGTPVLSVQATVTDTNGAVSTQFGTDTVSIVAGPPPTPITTGLAIQWGTPTARK